MTREENASRPAPESSSGLSSNRAMNAAKGHRRAEAFGAEQLRFRSGPRTARAYVARQAGLLAFVLAFALFGARCGFVEDLIDHTGGHDEVGDQMAAILLASIDSALAGTTSSTSTTSSASFNLSGASSTSGTTLSATFSETPASGATTLSNFCVTITSVSSFSACQSSPGVLALSGTPSQSGTSVSVTTATQTSSVYVLWVQNVTSSDGSALSISSASFIGTGAAAFNVTGATSGGSTTVRVNFSAVPTANHTTLGNYCVSLVNHTSFANCDADGANKLTISGTPALSGSQISITSATQSAVTYYVWVQNVQSSGLSLTVASASFTGQVPTPFNVDSASGVNSTTATVTYSEAPNTTQAQTTTNYCLTVSVVADFATCAGGTTLAVTNAVLSGSTVTLTTATQSGVTYYVWVQNVTSNASATALTTSNTSFSGQAPGPLTGLVINEIAYGTDWFVEIYNTTGASIDLGANGARLRRDSNCSLPSITSSITLSGTIPATGYFTVGRDDDTSTYAGFDQTAAGDSLNDDDCVAITDDASDISSATASNVIDFVGFGGAAAYEGSSPAAGWRNLSRCANGNDTDQNSTDFTGRSDAQRTLGSANNCTAATPFNVNAAASASGTSVTVTFSEAPYQSLAEVQGNYCITSNTSNATFAACSGDTGNSLALSGTPSLAGSVITLTTASQSAVNYKVFVQNVLSDAGGTQLTTDNATFTGQVPVPTPGVGDIIITEVMSNPAAVSDTTGEYVEIYNTTGSTLDITGHLLVDGGGTTLTLGSATIAANSYAVICRDTNSGSNGGIAGCLAIGSGSMSLTNSGEVLEFKDPSDTTVIDTIDYSGYAPAAGVSASLHTGFFSAAGNDTDSNWGTGTATYGSGDTGTPGTANDYPGSFTVTGANTGGQTTVTVTFSHAPTAGTGATGAENTGNYCIATGTPGTCTPALSISGASLSGSTVTLTTAAQTGGQAYRVFVSNVTRSSDSATLGTNTGDFTGSAGNTTATYLVISEVCYDDCSAGGGADDEYIELYNPTATPIDLGAGGYRLYRDTSGGGAPGTFLCDFTDNTHFNGNTLPASVVVPAHGYYLIVNDNAPAGLQALADALVQDARMLITADNTIYLGTGPITTDTDTDITDKVGFGSAAAFEGSGAAPSMSSGQSIERKAYVGSTGDTNGTTGMYTGGGHASNGNGEDTGDNSADWILRTTPEPQNRASATETP